MRTISAAQQAILDAPGGRSEHAKVEVKDSGGTWRDVTSYPTFNALDSFEVEEDIDSPHRTARVTLRREVEKLSLAPLMTASALNRAFNPAGSYAPLLKVGRELRISVAVRPADAAAADWLVFFHGRIDKINAAGGPQVKLICRDLGGAIADTWIEEERVYALAEVAGSPVELRIWQPNKAFPLNCYVIPTEAKRTVSGSPRFYKCTTAGTSGSTEPVWPTSSTVGDGAGTLVWTYQGTTSPGTGYAVETIMQQILTAWLATAVTLYVPTSPSWNCAEYIQQRGPVLEAVRSLAMQLGWDVRYKWRSSSSQFELTLYEPERSKTTPDATFAARDYEDIAGLETDISGVRNAWVGIHPNSADLDPQGNALPGRVEVSDATSITEYGRLFAEIGEDQLSVIRTTAQMTQMLNAALADTKDPKVEAEVPLKHGFPWVELGDLYRFSANGRHFDTDQDLAVARHITIGDGATLKTTLSVRGKPAGAYEIWHEMSGRNNPNEVHQLDIFDAPTGITLAAAEVVGGTRVEMQSAPGAQAFGAEWEVHLSETSSFTPSSSTYQGTAKGNAVVLPNLIPGKPYYLVGVPIIRNASKRRRGQPSAELSFTAGRGGAGHLVQGVDWGRLPLNGGFETWNDTGTVPDHWEMGSGDTWGGTFSRGSGAGGVSGDQYLVLTCNYFTTETTQTREFFTVNAGELFEPAWRIKINSAGSAGGMIARIDWYDYAGTLISSSTVDDVEYNEAGMTVGTWYVRGAQVTAPATAKFAKFAIQHDTAGDAVFHIDSVEFNVSPDSAKAQIGALSSATTTSASFATFKTYTDFVQRVPGRQLHFHLAFSCYSSAASTGVQFRLVVTYKDGTTTTTTAKSFFINPAAQHMPLVADWVVPGDTTAHGAVQVEVQWARYTGSGTLTMNSDDHITLTQGN